MRDTLMTAPDPMVQRAFGDVGFAAVGVTSADAQWLAGERLFEFIAHQRHGEMSWMETTLPRRTHPKAMWPDARSAIVVAMNYGPSENPLDALQVRDSGAVSVYARGSDYHDVLKKRLRASASEYARLSGAAVKIFVDTAP